MIWRERWLAWLKSKTPAGVASAVPEAQTVEPKDHRFAILSTALFWLTVEFFDPTVAFGLALGWVGLITLTSTALLAATGASLGVARIRRIQRPWAVRLVTVAAAGVLIVVQLTALGRWTPAGEFIGAARIEHFCLDHFRPRSCVRQVQGCILCAKRVDPGARRSIASRLEGAIQSATRPRR